MALWHWHYVALWGYNDQEQIFYVYDSNTKKKTETYPLSGVVKKSYTSIVKGWSIGATKLLYNYAIAVEY